MSKRRKNNDGISNSGYRLSWGLLNATQRASELHNSNRAETSNLSDYLDRHPLVRTRLSLMVVSGRINAKSSPKILRDLLKKVELETQ